ncbi:MAG: hypothetical protein ACTSYL_00450, partial [Candidatus Thorarchaeota archaeon]
PGSIGLRLAWEELPGSIGLRLAWEELPGSIGLRLAWEKLVRSILAVHFESQTFIHSNASFCSLYFDE